MQKFPFWVIKFTSRVVSDRLFASISIPKFRINEAHFVRLEYPVGTQSFHLHPPDIIEPRENLLNFNPF